MSEQSTNAASESILCFRSRQVGVRYGIAVTIQVAAESRSLGLLVSNFLEVIHQ
jgi:hypothetical protein